MKLLDKIWNAPFIWIMIINIALTIVAGNLLYALVWGK